MPVYVRKNLLSITPDSLSNRSNDEEDYITDPDQMIDFLPQPFRLVNKIITSVFDRAWERVVHREKQLEEERMKLPIPEYDNAEVIERYKESPGIVESPDGTALFLGLPNDLIVLDPVTHQEVTSWKVEEEEEQKVEEDLQAGSITTVQIGVQACLVISITKQGLCRLHIYSNPLLLFVKNLDTDLPPGSKVLKAFVSEDGDFLGLTVEGKEGDIWLDVFKLPRDGWIKDVENVQNEVAKQQEMQQNTQNGNDESTDEPTSSSHGGSPVLGASTTWNPSVLAKPTQVLRVTAPFTSVSGKGVSSISLPGASNSSIEEWISTIGVGKKHHLTEQHLQLRRSAAERELAPFLDHNRHDGINYTAERSSCCNCLVLNKTGRNSSLSTSPSDVNQQILVCSWNGTNYLSFYDLNKTGKDLEHKPDCVVPFGADISTMCSSPCGLLMAVGLKDGSVVLFDEFIGLPLFVEKVGNSEVQFLTVPVSSSVKHSTSLKDLSDLSAGGVVVIAGTMMGSLMSLTFDYTTRQVTKIQIREGSNDHKDQLQTISAVKSLHDVLLIMTNGGDVSLLDFLTGQVLCRVKVPPPYIVTSFDLDNMLSLAANGQQMLVKASPGESSEDDVSDTVLETALLAYQLQTFSCLDSRWKTLSEQESSPPTLLHTTPATKRVDLLLTKHLHDSKERQQRIQQRWEKLGTEKQQR